MVHFRTADTGDHRVFYREAGQPGSHAVLFLQCFPTSSHMFRDLIPLLADRYRVIAPAPPTPATRCHRPVVSSTAPSTTSCGVIDAMKGGQL